jgi:hypothetical protein
MGKLKLNIDVDLPKEKKGKSKRRKRVNTRNGKARGQAERIHLKAHNPGLGIPFSHNTPLIIEKPNIEQANKVTLLNQQLETQTKKLIDNDNKVGNLFKEGYDKVGSLINSLKTENANKISKIENKIEKKIDEVVKRSYVDEGNKLKEKYKAMGGKDEAILLTTRKPTIERAIFELEKKKSAGLVPNLLDYGFSKTMTPTAGILNTAVEESNLADLYADRSSSPVMNNDEEILIRKSKRVIKKK